MRHKEVKCTKRVSYHKSLAAILDAPHLIRTQCSQEARDTRGTSGTHLHLLRRDGERGGDVGSHAGAQLDVLWRACGVTLGGEALQRERNKHRSHLRTPPAVHTAQTMLCASRTCALYELTSDMGTTPPRDAMLAICAASGRAGLGCSAAEAALAKRPAEHGHGGGGPHGGTPHAGGGGQVQAL